MGDILFGLLGGTSLLGFTADLIAVYTFINTVRLKQYKDISRKLFTVIFVFIFSLLLFLLVRTPDSFNLDGILYVFSLVYILLAWLTVLISATALKGTKSEIKIYLSFALTAALSFFLGIFIVMLLGKHLQWMGLLFFLASFIQILYIVGEYILKRYLIAKGLKENLSLLGEYPLSFRYFIKEITALPELFKRELVTIETQNSNDIDDPESETVKPQPVQYKYWASDVAFVVYTATLGVILLILNTNYAPFIIRFLK